jgi:hypothetical protein
MLFYSETFAAFVAGVFNSYRPITLFIAIDDTPFHNLLFQRRRERLPYINLDGYRLGLVEALPDIDCMAYRITKDGCCAILFIFGIDATTPCGPTYNIVLIHFIWCNFELFSFKILFGDHSLPQRRLSTYDGVSTTSQV